MAGFIKMAFKKLHVLKMNITIGLDFHFKASLRKRFQGLFFEL